MKTVISVQSASNEDAYDDGGIDWSTIPVSSPPSKKSDPLHVAVAKESVVVENKHHAGDSPKLRPTLSKKRHNNGSVDVFDIDGIDWGTIGCNLDCNMQKTTMEEENSCDSITGATHQISNSHQKQQSGSIKSCKQAHEVQTQEQKHAPQIVRPMTPTKNLPRQQSNSPSTPKKHKAEQSKYQSLPSLLVPGSVRKGEQPAATKLPADLLYTPCRVAPIDDGNRAALIKSAVVSSKLDNGWTLLNHQKQAVLKGLKMRWLVLAYDMGLGKTVIACVWARAFKKTFPSLKILLIAPVSLHKEWKKTAYTATGLHMEKDTDDPFDMTISSWAKIPKIPSTSVEKFVVICDEAHSMQSMSSARTRDSLKLILDKRCVGCLLLTGTPMKNGKPSNLFPLLKAVRHPFGDDQKKFELYFCAGQQKNYGKGVVWDASGSSNLPTLNAHIVSHVIHLTKDECLKDLPAKERVYREVPVSSRHELKYIAALNELVSVFVSLKIIMD